MNLNDLIKKQKEQANGGQSDRPAAASDSAGKSNPVHADAASGGVEPRRTGEDRGVAAPAKPPVGRLNFGIANRPKAEQPADHDSTRVAVDSPAGLGVPGDSKPLTNSAVEAQPEPSTPTSAPRVGGLAGLLKKPLAATPATMAEAPTAVSLKPSNQDGSFSLADLDSFQGPAAIDPLKVYEDMIPVDLPDRPLPDDMTEQQRGFVELVESTYMVLNEPEAFGQVIRNLMAELSENPEYDKLIVDADINAMMRGMRQTMGLAQVKKASNKRGAGKKQTEKQINLAAAGAELDSMFGEGAFDD